MFSEISIMLKTMVGVGGEKRIIAEDYIRKGQKLFSISSRDVEIS